MEQADIEMNIAFLDGLKLPKPIYREEVCDYRDRVDMESDRSKYPKELRNEAFHFLTEEQVVSYLMKRLNVVIVPTGHTYRFI